MGLKGTELKDFIKEQQELEREERNQQREHDRIQPDKEDKFRLAQMDRDREKEQDEKQRREQKAKERSKDREIEREKMDFEFKMKSTAVTKTNSEIDEDEKGEENKEGSVASSHTRRRIGVRCAKMPCFDERSDDMDSFLHRFEAYADSQGWSKGQRAVYLSALLKGKALEVYSRFRLPVKDAKDYEILKYALLQRFNLTEEGFKQKFKSTRAEI